MYDWSIQELFRVPEIHNVSVVVERMYDWSAALSCTLEKIRSFSCCWKDVRLKLLAPASSLHDNVVSVVVERMYDWSQQGSSETRPPLKFQLLLKGCTIEAPKPTDWKQMIFDSWFLICFSKMVDLHKKCHYFRKFGVIWVIAWLFLIVVVTSSYILSTTKSP